MRILGTLALIIIVLAGAYYFIPGIRDGDTDITATSTPRSTDRTYTNAEHGISFEYPDSYSIREDDATVGLQEIFYVTLADTDALANVPQGGEGPPSITIGIFATDATSAEDWIREDPRSNFALSIDGRLTPTSVDGVSGLAYESDGLYATRNAVVLNGGRAYMFSVGWLTRADDIVADFDEMLATVDLL